MINRLTVIFLIFPLLLAAQSGHVAVGDKVPEFTFESAPGKSESIENYHGKQVLIVFFATWCGPCLQELPHLEREVWEVFGSNSKFDLLIFGREHSWDEVTQFKEKKGYKMPFYPDPKRAVFSLFAPNTIPRSYLVDEDGKVIFTTIGFSENSFSELLANIKAQLNM